MHIIHTHPSFADHFVKKHNEAKELCKSHPVFSQKTALIESMNAEHSEDVHQKALALQQVIVSQELPMLHNLRFTKTDFLQTHDYSMGTLAEEQKRFIAQNAQTVKKHFGSIFSALEEYALISDTAYYQHAASDYYKFQQAVSAVEQLKTMNELLSAQLLHVQRIDTKMNLGSAHVSDSVAFLKNSMQDQQILLTRLPRFR